MQAANFSEGCLRLRILRRELLLPLPHTKFKAGTCPFCSTDSFLIDPYMEGIGGSQYYMDLPPLSGLFTLSKTLDLALISYVQRVQSKDITVS